MKLWIINKSTVTPNYLEVKNKVNAVNFPSIVKLCISFENVCLCHHLVAILKMTLQKTTQAAESFEGCYNHIKLKVTCNMWFK